LTVPIGPRANRTGAKSTTFIPTEKLLVLVQ
jgi:hypothetical protein